MTQHAHDTEALIWFDSGVHTHAHTYIHIRSSSNKQKVGYGPHLLVTTVHTTKNDPPCSRFNYGTCVYTGMYMYVCTCVTLVTYNHVVTRLSYRKRVKHIPLIHHLGFSNFVPVCECKRARVCTCACSKGME